MHYNRELIIKNINDGEAFLGIEFGSTRIKAVLILDDGTPVAQGSHIWENRLEHNIWTYHMDDIITGLRTATKACVKTFLINMTHSLPVLRDLA